MVKPELKGEKPILLASESEDSNMEAHDQNEGLVCDNQDGTVMVAFDETRARKGPRVCVFVGLFVFVLVVGFLAVYLIGRTHGKDRNHALSTNMKDDIARVPTLEPELGNLSKYWQEYSWETRDELFQLSDTIGSKIDIIGLRPIFRKDLPKDYIAYWEVKMNGKKGEKYLIISAAKETGDHRLAQEGPLPSPIDIMTDFARLLSHSCHRVYRLTPDGLMTCEDTTLKRTVAATRDVETNSEFRLTKWRKLDRQVKKALPRFKKAWKDLARRVTKLPEWRRFKWLSMKSGQMPTEKSSKRGNNRHEHDDDDHNIDEDDDDDEMEAELAVRPGEVLKVPLMGKSLQIRVKFSGFGHTKRHGKKRKTWMRNRWQRKLCRVLRNPCEGSDMTRVKWRYVKHTKMGDRYIGLQIVSNSQYVRRQLQGQEIRFRIEVEMKGGKTLVVSYGIMLKHSRRGRSAEGGNVIYKIPHRHWFPNYKQHRHGLCMTGSGAVAWGMVLGYMENLAHRDPQSGYPKNILGLFPDTSSTSNTTTKHAQAAIENLFEKLHSRCSLEDEAALTSPAKMKRIGKWLNHTAFQLVIENDSVNKEKATARAIQLLQKRIPVILSKERGDSSYHHYSVATRLRQRLHRYRDCKITCSSWRTLVENEAYVHLGIGKYGNKWENIDTHFMAAIVKK